MKVKSEECPSTALRDQKVERVKKVKSEESEKWKVKRAKNKS